jgi:hypothetical protein
MRYRRQKIISDIYIISRQLLYYTGSRMNLHTKLVRCIPYTHMIRNELYMLTNEWYHNASYAISRFKQRIGTEEGYNFAETLNSLRQHESEEYYELLRQRVQDYKEKLELTKEGRKESVSYILFTLAGIPILFTFRVFIYPWVAEGQKLFDSLGWHEEDEGGELMRSILVTVMMLIVVALLFSSIVADDTNGLKKKIEDKGTTANTRITALDVDWWMKKEKYDEVYSY